MRVSIKKLAFALLVICIFAATTSAQVVQTGSPAERRAKEFIHFLESGNRSEFKKYVQENFSPEFLSVPMEEHLGFFSSIYDFTRGVEYYSAQDTAPNEVTALFKAKLTEVWVALVVHVESKPPYRIDKLGLRLPNPPPSSEIESRLSKEQIVQELEAFLKRLADADVFSGAVLLAKNGVPVFRAAYGNANKDFNAPNQIDTKFNLGSMNKMFTSVAIAQLVERGKLSFDTPLSTFLPEFPDRESSKKIKIKHLLTHTAGLGAYFSEKWNESSRALYRTVDDMMKRAAADEKLLFEPGSRQQYSNTGMLVLGKVIEKVTGESYYDYVRENITTPAGMTSTDCFELDKVNLNLAIGYNKEITDEGTIFRNNLFSHVIRGGPMGGGYSTVEDLLKFAAALQSNRLVGAQYVKLLLSPKPELNSPNYGYGFSVNSELQIAGHSGGFIGISSNLDMFLKTGWTAIVMSNYSHGAEAVQQKILKLVQSELATD
jgi:CubicO group peptidase (beta-lactamase class C family)